jgi:hypothetical protein
MLTKRGTLMSAPAEIPTRLSLAIEHALLKTIGDSSSWSAS